MMIPVWHGTWTDPMSDTRTWRHLYNRKRWKKLRLDHLAENPLCVMCKQEGRVTVAEVVDHITPHKGDEDLFHNPMNLQGLCKLHHDAAKQKAEKNKVNTVGCGEDGIPKDPGHHWHAPGGGS